MNQKEFQRYLDRDGGIPFDAGFTTDTAVPQHRIPRGMGGSKERDVPSNIITFTSYTNGLVASNARAWNYAYVKGWVLRTTDDPRQAPVYHARLGWRILDDQFGSEPADKQTVATWRNHVVDYLNGR